MLRVVVFDPDDKFNTKFAYVQTRTTTSWVKKVPGFPNYAETFAYIMADALVVVTTSIGELELKLVIPV